MQKIATCCYCGIRAALVLSEGARHELSCSSCGAPLHEMKRLRSPAPASATRPAPAQRPAPRYAKHERPKKRAKSLKKRIFKEAFDFLEDLFD